MDLLEQLVALKQEPYSKATIAYKARRANIRRTAKKSLQNYIISIEVTFETD